MIMILLKIMMLVSIWFMAGYEAGKNKGGKV